MIVNATRRIANFVPPIRWSSDCGGGASRTGLVLGIYQDECTGECKFTPTGAKFDEDNGGKLKELVKGSDLRKGVARVFTNVSNDFPAVAVSGLGQEGVGWNQMEKLDECKENIRIATALGTKALQDDGIGSIFVEPFTNAEAAAESAVLAVWKYQDQKTKENRQPTVKVDLFENADKDGWARGKLKSDNQNLARKIEETPGNLMTPTLVAEIAVETLCSCGVAVEVRDKDWIENHKMQAFLAMARGSCEPPILLELGYCGGSPDAEPVVLVGKGITFDTGGMCLKNCPNMSEYRGDLAGGAVVLAAMKCAAQMALPINLIGLIPLCENMPGGMAAKPGDVVYASNGRSVTIEDTDNEGRVILADALIYSGFFKPCVVLELSTLTPGIRRCLGTSSSGTFTNSEVVWRELERAGGETGDRLWRFPFWKIYRHRVTNYVETDTHNVGLGRITGAVCKAAAFCLEFAPKRDFVHMDITGTGLLSNGVGHPYLREGMMTGRPTRTIVQFLYQLACPHSKGDEC